MFGPDKCGNDHKLHFIFRHRNPKNGSFEEKHCKKPKLVGENIQYSNFIIFAIESLIRICFVLQFQGQIRGTVQR